MNQERTSEAFTRITSRWKHFIKRLGERGQSKRPPITVSDERFFNFIAEVHNLRAHLISLFPPSLVEIPDPGNPRFVISRENYPDRHILWLEERVPKLKTDESRLIQAVRRNVETGYLYSVKDADSQKPLPPQEMYEYIRLVWASHRQKFPQRMV